MPSSPTTPTGNWPITAERARALTDPERALGEDVHLTPSLSNLALLLCAPEECVELRLVLPQGFTTLETEINPS